MNERPLFDLATLELHCPICGCDKDPRDLRARDCGVDLSRAGGEWIRRPNECLNTPRPETNPIPY